MGNQYYSFEKWYDGRVQNKTKEQFVKLYQDYLSEMKENDYQFDSLNSLIEEFEIVDGKHTWAGIVYKKSNAGTMKKIVYINNMDCDYVEGLKVVIENETEDAMYLTATADEWFYIETRTMFGNVIQTLRSSIKEFV